MTRDEAIKWFRESPFWHKDHVPFNMAIQALEQITKIADLLDGTIDHFDRDDAMDMLYEIKGVIK